MNKEKLILLFFLLISFISPKFIHSKAYALQTPNFHYYPLPIGNIQNFLGENQTYSIVFRGNGESVVSFKSVIYNNNNNFLSRVRLHFTPDILLKDISVFQVLQDTNCIRYKQTPPLQQLSPTTLEENKPLEPISSNVEPNNLNPLPPFQQICQEYAEPDFQNFSGNIKYQEAIFDYSSNTLTIQLPQPIKSHSNGNYFVNYRTFAYTQKNIFGAYNFRFETPEFENKINSLQIGISTDSDLILQGEKENVNYTTVKNSVNYPSMTSQSPGIIRNSSFDNFYNQIGQGDIEKNVSSLEPFETYKIEGSYADSLIRLYGKTIEINICIFILFAIFLFLIIKYIVYKLRVRVTNVSPLTSTNIHNSQIHFFLLVSGISFGSIVLMSLYVIITFFISLLLQSTNYGFVFLLILLLISLIVNGFLFCAPSLVVGVKKGWIWGIITFSMTIFWFIFFLLTIIIIFYLFFPQINNLNPINNFLKM